MVVYEVSSIVSKNRNVSDGKLLPFKQLSEIYICFEGKCLQYPAHVEIPYCGEILELEGFRRDNIKLHCLHLFDFSPVCLQMSPQIACLREGIYTSAAICI